MRDDHHDKISDDRVEGSLKQTGGKLKEGIGRLVGDEKIKHEGKADQAKGKLQNSWGGLKDSVREDHRD